jgi:hypothetical protein
MSGSVSTRPLAGLSGRNARLGSYLGTLARAMNISQERLLGAASDCTHKSVSDQPFVPAGQAGEGTGKVLGMYL